MLPATPMPRVNLHATKVVNFAIIIYGSVIWVSRSVQRENECDCATKKLAFIQVGFFWCGHTVLLYYKWLSFIILIFRHMKYYSTLHSCLLLEGLLLEEKVTRIKASYLGSAFMHATSISFFFFNYTVYITLVAGGSTHRDAILHDCTPSHHCIQRENAITHA